MSKFIGRNPLPPIVGTNDVLAWDGTEFRPTRSISVNPVFGAISAAALALAIGTGISDANAIGFLPSVATPGSESLTLYVGGAAGPVWTRAGSVVNLDLQNGTFKAASVTNTALTNGRIPFTSTASVAADSAGFTLNASTFVLGLGDGTTTAVIQLNGVAGQQRRLDLLTAGSLRWQMFANTTAEGGANAGSDLVITARSDAGAVIDNPIVITRVAGGAITFTRPLQPGSGSVGAPVYAFSTDTTTGLFRAGSGILSIASAGVETARFPNGGGLLISRNTSVLLNTAPITAVGTATIHGGDAVNPSLALCAYGASPLLMGRQANGTASALTATVSSNAMLALQVGGYEGTTPGFTAIRSAYQIIARETYTSTAQSYAHTWLTIQAAGTTNAERMRLENSGNLLIGTTTDGLTASGSLAIAQDLAHRGTNLGVFNTSPIAKKTGYGTPTGNAYQASFAAGSITLANLAAGVAQLILDLKAYGLIGT